MTAIITIEEVKDGCVNNDLYQLCQSNPIDVERYTKTITNKIFAYIDKEQFKQEDGGYMYPDDLKVATLQLLESMYIFGIEKKGVLAGKKHIKADDYAETTERNADSGALQFFGIPIDSMTLAILDGYRDQQVEDCGMWGVDIH